MEYPSCLHTTVASRKSQPSSHTVPNDPLTHTSTLPSRYEFPPTNLTEPSVHTGVTLGVTLGVTVTGMVEVTLGVGVTVGVGPSIYDNAKLFLHIILGRATILP